MVAAKPKGRAREEAAGEKAFVEMLGEEHNTRVATAARVNFMVNNIELYDASHTQVERVSDAERVRKVRGHHEKVLLRINADPTPKQLMLWLC